MALPPRAGARYVILGNPEASEPYPAGVTQLPVGNPTHDYVDTYAYYTTEGIYPSPPRQQPFNAYQDWYPEYPNECVVKVSQGVSASANYVRFSGSVSIGIETKFPDDIVTSYNPGPPDYTPAPDPNGTVGEYTGTTGVSVSWTPFPRWYEADPYDMAQESSYDFWKAAGYFPEKNHDYFFGASGGSLSKACSCDFTVTNKQSIVYNEQTSEDEFYPFTQETFHYKQTATFTIPKEWVVCCWNKGTVIEGGVSFSSIDCEAEALGNLFTPDYGFGGMKVTTGDTISPESDYNFSLTISDPFTPIEIEIPALDGKMTFITDFWIDTVTPPA